MHDIKNISIEFKSMIFFGLFAFLLSFLSGIIARVGFGSVLLRSLILGLVFAGLGYGIIIIFKKYVPEVFSALQHMNKAQGDDISDLGFHGEKKSAGTAGGSAAAEGDADFEPEPAQAETSMKKKGEEFNELKKEDFPQYDSMKDQATESLLNTGEGKLGKHIVVKEKDKEIFGKYEPKLMAQAVRTMLSKEE